MCVCGLGATQIMQKCRGRNSCQPLWFVSFLFCFECSSQRVILYVASNCQSVQVITIVRSLLDQVLLSAVRLGGSLFSFFFCHCVGSCINLSLIGSVFLTLDQPVSAYNVRVVFECVERNIRSKASNTVFSVSDYVWGKARSGKLY